ncbi:MAG: excinuclease ABC subunit UvrA [Polyangiaceae bacterium]|nr:excinuclease ABC subunit UvrA [Polyangiaceae bacterium]
MHNLHLVGARTHNLKNVSLDLTPGELVGIAGVSGSGKSSLALDTLYSEGQRRFVESFSPYARQFLERLERPPMDELDPVAAGVAVDRRAPVKSSRSTVATMTDIEPYFSALFTREAVPICPTCNVAAVRTDAHGAAKRVGKDHAGRPATVAYRIPVDGPEAYLTVRDSLAQAGYRRLFLQGKTRDIDEVAPSEVLAGNATSIDVVIDRIKLDSKEDRRIGAAIEEAWRRAEGQAALFVQTQSGVERVSLVRGLVCPSCARSFDPPRAGLFSYQSPIGACPACRGFGRTIGIDWDKVFPDESRTLAAGAIRPWSGASTTWERKVLKKYCDKVNIPMDVPWGKLTEAQRRGVIEGEGSWYGGKFPGVRKWFEWLETRTYKMHVRVLLARYRAYDICQTCSGKRLSNDSLMYRVGGLDLAAWHTLELRNARASLAEVNPTTGQGAMARAELMERLSYLERVGLGYLTLDRQARTLSGGEAQRVSLTSALGTSLTGALFVLDEPTVGLHVSDIPPLIDAMRELARRGNVVLVIEHEPVVLKACDRIIELGPGAGKNGGNLVYDGSITNAAGRTDLAVGRALFRPPPRDRTKREAERHIGVVGASANNLRDVTVNIPLDMVVAITGASGSGKSTLVDDILYRTLARARGYRDIEAPGKHTRVEGTAAILSVSLVDQAPLGRTSRGNPATYTGAWDRIRQLLAMRAKEQNLDYSAAHFSFNVAGGRCEACSGEGFETIEMQFLADVALTCASCQGRRFRDEVLEVKINGRSVSDILAMTVDEALSLFASDKTVVRTLGPAKRLGLGYLALGQPLSTLSGGEAQRLKLARALSEPQPNSLVILDEPSAGLHADEVEYVNDALDSLVKMGASVIVVDHDLDIVGAADWVIDLGPGAGTEGGKVVAEGTPEEVARSSGRTGQALAGWFARGTLSKKSTQPAESGAAGTKKKKGSVKSEGKSAGAPTPVLPVKVTEFPRAIEVICAREHNLANITVDLPHNKLVVVTGPSGSGKSTLAFDVVFAEGQRRFLETLTPYARQFLPTLPRPDVDRVSGVPPSIALEQRTTRAGSSSTVSTVTEVAHYLRLLYAKVGDAYCPKCDVPIAARSAEETYRALKSVEGDALLLAPAVVARKGTYLDVFTAAARAGMTRAFADGVECDTDKPPRLDKRKEHSIDLVVYQGSFSNLDKVLFDRAIAFGKGSVKVRRSPSKKAKSATLQDELYSTTRTCPRCGMGVPELDPRWFSFNTKQGRCEACEGTGIEGGSEGDTEGTGPACSKCQGSRLSPLPRSVRLSGERYHEVSNRSVADAAKWAAMLAFSGNAAKIAEAPHAELLRRLNFIVDVGLGYLSLDRRAATLSGGEMQRLRLAAQLGSGLTGALYVLDEPTIGLHPRDTRLLLTNLRKLVEMGSTVLMVEHDADTIRAADHLIDLGPTGGRGGGRIIAAGEPSIVLANPNSPTARALEAEHAIIQRRKQLGPAADAIELVGGRAHNLKGEKVTIPEGRLTVVAGVSGSGKSTLVRHVLYPAARKLLKMEGPEPGAFDSLKLPKSIGRALAVDQSPIGRTPRSVPATFLGIWDEIRRLFAVSPDAQVRGFTNARFSFNTPHGGRCTACDGQGVVSHEMSFLPDATTVCEACGGSRFDPATLDIKYLGLSIGQVLHLTIEEAVNVFSSHPKIRDLLATMRDLGLGYLQLGQGSHTLSGGEAQRLKLATELTTNVRGKRSLYVLDEPTTGLHLADVARLIDVLDKLVQRGDTLVVIEHHPAVIACADHVLELGPEGGAQGGRVVAEGPPKEVAKKKTATGLVLKELLRS